LYKIFISFLLLYFAERHIPRCQQRRPHKAAAGTHPTDYATNATAATANDCATTTAATATNYYSVNSGSRTNTKDPKTVHQVHRVARQHFQQFRKWQRDQQRKIESEAKGLESLTGKCSVLYFLVHSLEHRY